MPLNCSLLSGWVYGLCILLKYREASKIHVTCPEVTVTPLSPMVSSPTHWSRNSAHQALWHLVKPISVFGNKECRPWRSTTDRVCPQTWPMVIAKSPQSPSSGEQEEEGDRKQTERKSIMQSLLLPPCWMRIPLCSPHPQLCQGSQCLYSLAGKHVGRGHKALLGL